MGRGVQVNMIVFDPILRAHQLNASVQQVVRPTLNRVSGSAGSTELN